MKQTVLHQKHSELKARMADFQGWQVPQLYSDIQEEYHAVRTTAGLFDISFLGRIEITGNDSVSFLNTIFTRNTAKMPERAALYGVICNEAGYVLDDPVLFHLPDVKGCCRFLLTTNAVNTDKILSWLKKHSSGDVQITDKTNTTAQLSIQGPRSTEIVERFAGPTLKKLRPRTIKEINILDTSLLLSRTGFTGEQGYEFFVPSDKALSVWDGLMNAGKDFGILPCGTASRDILRLEMGYLLYGSDIDETRTPLEACLTSFVDFKKNFIGKDALLKRKAEGIKQKLAGFVLLDKNVPRSGGSIFSENREIGVVTSGSVSPWLRKGFGLGYVVTRYSQPGQEIEIEIRDKEIVAKIVELPFFRKK